jgi:GMP synthase (glutamine-hydrolysing)
MTRLFLILQLRPETEAADDEFAAILCMSGLLPARARRIRLDREDLPEDLNLDDHAGVIVGGGPGCVSDAPDRKSPVEARIEAQILGLMPAITGADRPFLGCCHGIGILGAHLGAEVSKRAHGVPVGTADCRLTEAGAADPLLAGVPPRFDAFVGHKEALQSLPDGAGFETRIRIYRHKGYFAPEEADSLIAMCRTARVEAPARILRNFITRYG